LRTPTAAIESGASIEAAVEGAANGAMICLKNGIHRAQTVRSRPRQHFHHPEWQPAVDRLPARGPSLGGEQPTSERLKYGECLPSAPAYDRPNALFIEDQPLTIMVSKDPNFYTLDSLEID
jgi:hypothetical protein